jgi:hypothetical protein
MNHDLNLAISLWKVIRAQILKLIYSQDIEKLFKIPAPLSNNLIWIFGHIIRTRNFLILTLSKENSFFPNDLDPLFAKGSSPQSWNFNSNQKEELVNQLFKLEEGNFESLIKYIHSNPDKVFTEPYQTSTGFVIDSIKSAVQYNLVHESIHLGKMELYKKLIEH